MKLLDVLFRQEKEEIEPGKSRIARELRRLRWMISTGIKRAVPVRHEDLGGKKDLIRDATIQVGGAYDDFPKLKDPEAEHFYKNAIDGITNSLRKDGEIVITFRDFSILHALGRQKGIQQITLIPAFVLHKLITGGVHENFFFMRVVGDEEGEQILQRLGMGAMQEIISPSGEGEK